MPPRPTAASRPLRYRPSAAIVPPLLVLLAAAAIAWSPLPAASSEARASYGVQGYAAIVDRLFGPMKWLQLAAPDAPPGANVVDLSAEAESLPQVREFVVRSPLLADIAANDERLWRLEGSHVAGLDPHARHVPGPFAAAQWTGDILYQSGLPAGVLTADRGGAIEVRPKAPGPAAAGPMAEISIATGDRRWAVEQGFRFTDERGQPLGDVRLVGRDMVVFPLPQDSAQILVDERERSSRTGAGTGEGLRALVVAHGGAIRFERDGLPVGASFRLAPVANGLSTYRPFAPRVTDSGLGRFGETIEAAVAAAGLDGSGDVELTLDPNLHGALQRRLENFASSLTAAEAQDSFRAAALVMDTLTGDLLALASYPTRQPAKAEVFPDSWISRNHNFSTLPIGSVAKGPVSAAILSQYPDLGRLVIQGSPGSFASVLGIDMDGDQTETASLQKVGFTDFLKHSSNKFATALMLMALASDPYRPGACPSEPYWLEGTGPPRQTAPRFLVSRLPRPCGPRFGPFNGRLSSILDGATAKPHWLAILRQAFAIPGVEQNPEQRFDSTIWTSLIRGREAHEPAFFGVSPERESFRLGTVRQFHNDYINLILGGVHSRWTNVKVAEAYSRLVTGRRISASLAREARSARSENLTGLRAEARRQVLAGLEEVARPGGTAAPYLAAPLAALRAAAPSGEQIRVFAKTGTPSLARSRAVPARTALNNLAALDIVILDSANRLTIARKLSSESDLAALQRNDRARQEAARQGVSLAEIAAELPRVRRLIQLEPRALRQGRRLVLPTSRLVEKGAGGGDIHGGVIAIVIGRYCAGETDPAKAIRALTLVINVQARHGGNPAGTLAGEWFAPDGGLAARLLSGLGRCRTSGAA